MKKINTIVTLAAAVLLSTAVVPAVSAQQREMPEGVEVITILAKRPALAAACLDRATHTEVAAPDADAKNNAGEKTDRQSLRPSSTQCNDQVATAKTGRG